MIDRSNRRKQRTRSLVLVLLVLGIGNAWGQVNVGEVQIYVFSRVGLPLEGAYVEVDGQRYLSDINGLVDFVHPAGTHQFTIYQDGRPIGIVEVPIRAAQATEVIITASDDPVVQEERALREEIEAEERVRIDEGAPSGSIQGEIVGIESGEPVAHATVIFRGVDFETTTDAEGRFFAELPAGTYSFSVIHPDFSSQTQDGIEVAEGEAAVVTVTLTPSAIELDEVPVFASEEVIVQGGIANLIEETRNSAVVLNLIGAEQIDRTGDSDAAGALRRVTGLTVVDGRFVYVRGMGERYSSSLLNGARLPSPEPDRRVVPLDLFPASVIESIAVQKSYSPELPGDFGGGAISIRSAGIPDDRYQRRLRTNISASLGYNIGTTFTDQLMAQGGDLDFLGIDDGTRGLPDDLDGTDYVEEDTGGPFGSGTGLSAEDVADLGKSLPNRWEPDERTIPLDYGLSASVRDKIELTNGGSFGFNIATLYSNSWGHETGELNSYQIGGESETTLYNGYDTEKTTQNVDLGGLIDLVWEVRRGLSFEATSLLVRTTENSFEVLNGELNDESLNAQLTESLWTEDMLFSQGVGTEIVTGIMNGAVVDAGYTFSLAERYQPDATYLRYEEILSGRDFDETYDEEYGTLSDRGVDDNQRVWTTVRDYVHDTNLSIEIPVFLFNRAAPDFLDVGLYGMYQTRETDLRRFAFVPTGDNQDDPIYWGDPGNIFAPENIGDEIEFLEVTYPADNYSGTHTIGAGYMSIDAILVRDIRINTGARVEYSRQALVAYSFPEAEKEEPVLETVDVMPALNFTFPVLERSQIRLGGSQTINRPDLRELSSAPYFGPPGFGVVQGNPDLDRATIWNADLRWETYFSLDESVSLGVFYKYFQNPIEIAQLQGPSFTKVPINIDEANNIGVELEWAFQLRFLSDAMRRLMIGIDFASAERERRWRRSLGALASFFRDLRTTGNVALIHSRINYGDQKTVNGVAVANTSSERPLQGQAPYVINAAIGYRNAVSWNQSKPVHTSVFLNYNVVGPFIFDLGLEGVDDLYQQPFHQVDLVIRQQFGHIVSAGLEFGNILNPVSLQTVGSDRDGEVVEEARRGRSVTVSVSLDL